jgi:hypothetical protein
LNPDQTSKKKKLEKISDHVFTNQELRNGYHIGGARWHNFDNCQIYSYANHTPDMVAYVHQNIEKFDPDMLAFKAIRSGDPIFFRMLMYLFPSQPLDRYLYDANFAITPPFCMVLINYLRPTYENVYEAINHATSVGPGRLYYQYDRKHRLNMISMLMRKPRINSKISYLLADKFDIYRGALEDIPCMLNKNSKKRDTNDSMYYQPKKWSMSNYDKPHIPIPSRRTTGM